MADGTGTILMPPGSALKVRSDAPDWHIAQYEMDEILESKVIWAYRVFRLIAHVAGLADTVDLSTVGFRSTIGGYPESTPAHLTPAPWNPTWASGHAVDEPLSIVGPREDQTFVITLQRARYLVVSASAPGWRPCIVDVPMPHEGEDTVRAEFMLQKAKTLAGIVRSSGGKPLAGVSVRIQIHKEGPSAAVGVERLRVTGLAMSAATTLTGSFLNIEQSLTTDRNGRFDWDIPFEGDVTVLTNATGHVPQRTALGRTIPERGTVGIDLQPVGGSREKSSFRIGEARLANCLLAIVDVTDPSRELALELPLDEAGEAVTDWLETGREYWLVTKRPNMTGPDASVSGFVRWDNRRVVDFATLVHNMDDFKKGVR